MAGSKQHIKFDHPLYISEKEICDRLETKLFPKLLSTTKVYREQKIGPGKADFLMFHGDRTIEIIEVKLTADMDSIRQLVFYKRLVEYYLTSANETQTNQPAVLMHLMARNFDSKIIDLLYELEIYTSRIIVADNGKFTVETSCPELDPQDPSSDYTFTNILKNRFFGGLNG